MSSGFRFAGVGRRVLSSGLRASGVGFLISGEAARNLDGEFLEVGQDPHIVVEVLQFVAVVQVDLL